MNELIAVDVFREIAAPNSTGNQEAGERVGLARSDERLGPALEKFKAERGRAAGNFALAAIALGSGHINPQDIEATVRGAKLYDLGDVFAKLAQGYTPVEIVSFPIEYSPKEVDPMVKALTAAGIFDAGRNDLHPDVVGLLCDGLQQQPPIALAARRIKQLWPE